MDVKCAFLNGDFTQDIYMQQPQGFVTNPFLMCRLKKSLYGLKQAPKAWYAKIDGFLLSLSFVRCKSDPNVYLKLIHGSFMIIVLYADQAWNLTFHRMFFSFLHVFDRWKFF